MFMDTNIEIHAISENSSTYNSFLYAKAVVFNQGWFCPWGHLGMSGDIFAYYNVCVWGAGG